MAKIDFSEVVLVANLKCPKCNKDNSIILLEHDISAGESQCELCGSHGDISFECKCPKCKETINVTVRSW